MTIIVRAVAGVTSRALEPVRGLYAYDALGVRSTSELSEFILVSDQFGAKSNAILDNTLVARSQARVLSRVLPTSHHLRIFRDRARVRSRANTQELVQLFAQQSFGATSNVSQVVLTIPAVRARMGAFARLMVTSAGVAWVKDRAGARARARPFYSRIERDVLGVRGLVFTPTPSSLVARGRVGVFATALPLVGARLVVRDRFGAR